MKHLGNLICPLRFNPNGSESFVYFIGRLLFWGSHFRLGSFRSDHFYNNVSGRSVIRLKSGPVIADRRSARRLAAPSLRLGNVVTGWRERRQPSTSDRTHTARRIIPSSSETPESLWCEQGALLSLLAGCVWLNGPTRTVYRLYSLVKALHWNTLTAQDIVV